MPSSRIPDCTLIDAHHSSDNSMDDFEKIDGSSSSIRSCSPKSVGHSSEISDTSDSAISSLEFSDNVSEEGGAVPQSDLLIEEFEALKMTEEVAEELTAQGADMRHVLRTSWKLQTKFPMKKLSSSGRKSAPGKALRDMASAQRLSIEEHMMSRHHHGGKVSPPPGFGGAAAASQISYFEEPAPILVSYADGSNSLTLVEKPHCFHNITVSCVEDSCHVFIQQRRNPTFHGLVPLEEAIAQSFIDDIPDVILRPIARGSLLAVFTDDKWYRCQVVAYNEKADSAEVKFVDHGGYTTVEVSQLRQLRSDFVRLPFQAIEVYIAHVSPASDEIVIDIASDVLFRDEVSLQHLGFAEDGLPVVQAYFYQGDYINLFTQEFLDDCHKVLLDAFPDYVPQPTLPAPESDSVCSDETLDTSSQEGDEEDCCSVVDGGEDESTDEGVWSPEVQEDADLVGPVVEAAAYYPEDYPWMSVSQPMVVQCVPDPETGAIYYMATPLVPAPVYQPVYMPEENVDYLLHKPTEEWTQEDYELYYGME